MFINKVGDTNTHKLREPSQDSRVCSEQFIDGKHTPISNFRTWGMTHFPNES